MLGRDPFSSYAEMDGPAKNAISHRYRALEKLKEYLMSQ